MTSSSKWCRRDDIREISVNIFSKATFIVRCTTYGSRQSWLLARKFFILCITGTRELNLNSNVCEMLHVDYMFYINKGLFPYFKDVKDQNLITTWRGSHRLVCAPYLDFGLYQTLCLQHHLRMYHIMTQRIMNILISSPMWSKTDFKYFSFKSNTMIFVFCIEGY